MFARFKRALSSRHEKGPGSEAPALLLEPKQGSNTLSSPGSGSRCPARRDAKHSASSTPKVVKPKPLTYLAPSTESEGTLSQTDTPNTQNTCSSLGSSISKPSSYSHFSSSNSGPTGSSMLSEGPSHATMVMQRINKLQATNSNVQDCSPSSAKTSGPLWHSPGTPSTMGRQRTPSRNNAVAEHSGRQSTVLPPVPRTDSNRSAVDLDQPHRSQCIGTYDRQPQQQQQQYTTQPVNGNAHNAMPAVCAASPPPATLLYCFPDAPEAMHRGSWSLDDYGLLERIHKGRSSAVFKALCLRSGQPVVLKLHYLDRVPANTLHMVQRELRIHAALSHRNVLPLYAAFQEGEHLVMVQEYAVEGDLSTLVKRLQAATATSAHRSTATCSIGDRNAGGMSAMRCSSSGRLGSGNVTLSAETRSASMNASSVSTAAAAAAAAAASNGGNHGSAGRLSEAQVVSLVVRPLLRALAYMHSQGFAHRDIKPENVLFKAGWVLQLADFGVSIDMRSERAVTRTGTASYMAPEILRCPLKRHAGDNKDNTTLAYGPPCDIFSLGVLTLELLVGRSVRAHGAEALALSLQAMAQRGELSIDAAHFALACCPRSPLERPSAAELLSHPWLCGLSTSPHAYMRTGVTGRASADDAAFAARRAQLSTLY